MKRRIRFAPIACIGFAVGCGAAAVVALQPDPPRVAAPPAAAGPQPMVAFEHGMGSGWLDFGWGEHELKPGEPARISFRDYGGFILHHDLIERDFSELVVRYRAPAEFGAFLQVSLIQNTEGAKQFPHVLTAGHEKDLGEGLREVHIAWAALNPLHLPFDGIVLNAATAVGADWVTIELVTLLPASSPAAPSSTQERDTPLAIRCDQPGNRINPMIYGAVGEVSLVGATAVRAGGNPMSRMNWELGAWNTGHDWYFENLPASWTPFSGTTGAVLPTAFVIPMLGWVAKDKSSVGFSVAKYGAQQSVDPQRPDAGNGVRADGSSIKPGPPSDTSVPAPPALIEAWVARLRKADEAGPARRAAEYILDNEPSLWHVTHRDVHPDPLSYDELLDRTIKYATAVRKADPSVMIAGPAEWGWSGYFFSAKDLANGAIPRADRAAHGGVALLPWYLRKLAEHERKSGTRLLDIVDVHYYPQADGVYANARIDAQSAALRLRSTRALWDPSYVDESWIGEAVYLIPRLKQWIHENYPGRGISIGEWNFGAEQHISGGLAVAEVLGRFGQQGVSSAFYWTVPPAGSPAFYAFRAYRNYDGKGAHFLDWSVPTVDTPDVSLFASRDETRSKLVAVVVNRSPDYAAKTTLDLSTCGRVARRRVFAFGAQSQALDEQKAAEADLGASISIAPYAIEVLELELAPNGGP